MDPPGQVLWRFLVVFKAIFGFFGRFLYYFGLFWHFLTNFERFFEANDGLFIFCALEISWKSLEMDPPGQVLCRFLVVFKAILGFFEGFWSYFWWFEGYFDLFRALF
jgi:hypothetical protein